MGEFPADRKSNLRIRGLLISDVGRIVNPPIHLFRPAGLTTEMMSEQVIVFPS